MLITLSRNAEIFLKSKIEFVNNNFNLALMLVLSVKLMALGFSWTDCFASLILLSFVNVYKVVGFKYPNRQDVYADLENLNQQFQELSKKNEELQRDVTGLKLGQGFKR